MKPKRAKPFAANNASLKALEASGWTVGIVEIRIPHCFISRMVSASWISRLWERNGERNQGTSTWTMNMPGVS